MLNPYNGAPMPAQDVPADPVLDAIRGQLQLLTERLAKLNDRASGMADRVFGSQPPMTPAINTQAKSSPTAKLDQIRSEIESAHYFADSLESSVGRFSQL